MEICRFKNKNKNLKYCDTKLWGQKSTDLIIHRLDSSSFLISNLPPSFSSAAAAAAASLTITMPRPPRPSVSPWNFVALFVRSSTRPDSLPRQMLSHLLVKRHVRSRRRRAWPASDSAPSLSLWADHANVTEGRSSRPRRSSLLRSSFTRHLTRRVVFYFLLFFFNSH